MVDISNDILEFAKNLQQEIISESLIEDQETYREEKFTEFVMEYLIEAEEIDNPILCSLKSKGLKINGYAISEGFDTLSLFVSIYTGEIPPINILKTDVDSNIKWLYNFFKRSLLGLEYKLEESSPVFDLARIIHELKNELARIRLYVLTDGNTKIEAREDIIEGNYNISYHIWDIQRIYRLHSSGNRREAIEIDFINKFDYGICCLPMPETNPPNPDYITYLSIIPAKILVELYALYGPRLLERNVRSFLSVRGNVNKGIRKTILEEPHMFLAYNNGLSITAEKVDIECPTEGLCFIRSAKDFQIVNGGQTTASLYNAFRKDGADISQILVPVKITVLKDNSKLDLIVPKISEYANSQNKVNSADFSANDQFHIKIEEFSRTIWAPAPSGIQKETHWYYERARGQYLDEKSREQTPAKKKLFESINPSLQKFTKTDLAKYENTWTLLPHKVSFGAEKNFREFTVRLKEQEKLIGHKFVPDQQYFMDLVAKAILFKGTEKLVSKQNYGGYRANIVTYTIALIVFKTAGQINLNKLWKDQSISLRLSDLIISVSQIVHNHITNPPNGRNITEWCKNEKCWELLKLKEIDYSSLPNDILIESTKGRKFTDIKIGGLSEEDTKRIKFVKTISPELWGKLSRWARETNNLSSRNRQIAYSLSQYSKLRKEPSSKMAYTGLEILKEANRLGFIVEELKNYDNNDGKPVENNN